MKTKEGYGPSTYGDRIIGTYDETHASLFDAEHVAPAVDLLAKLTLGGRALELGIGTGRIALPLAAKGVPIQGIDASEAMVAMLRAKEGGGDIPVSIGDFAEFEAIDANLTDTPSLELPEQITDFIAECVIEEAEL